MGSRWAPGLSPPHTYTHPGHWPDLCEVKLDDLLGPEGWRLQTKEAAIRWASSSAPWGLGGALVVSNQAALSGPCTLQPGLWGVQGRECAESHQLEG